MTPFKKAGYTKETKFKVLRDFLFFKKGDILTLYEDDGSITPYFITEDGRLGCIHLPGHFRKELEVYTEASRDESVVHYAESGRPPCPHGKILYGSVCLNCKRGLA